MCDIKSTEKSESAEKFHSIQKEQYTYIDAIRVFAICMVIALYSHHLGESYSYSKYLTAAEIASVENLPVGITSAVFGGYPCLKFHYIGKHHYRKLSRETAADMYKTIDKFSPDGSRINLKIYLKKLI